MKNIVVSRSFYLCTIWSTTSTNEIFERWVMISLKHVDLQISLEYGKLSRTWSVVSAPFPQHSQPSIKQFFSPNQVSFSRWYVFTSSSNENFLILLHTLTAQINFHFLLFCKWLDDWPRQKLSYWIRIILYALFTKLGHV